MDNLAQKILSTEVSPGSLAIFWLAQAGFVFKTPAAKIVYTDPYLTDYVQRALPEYGQGFKRLMPKILLPEEVEADAVVSTHSHQDHLDVDALPTLCHNPRIHFYGSPDCRLPYEEAGIPPDRFTIFHRGETLDADGFRLTGVFADHGDLAPDALGVLFDFDGIKVWQVGDTAYRPDAWQDLFASGIDIILPPINGAYGNLNSVEAARLVRDSGARIAIPCHFWMFALHYGNPAEFLEFCREFAPKTETMLMTQGEMFIYQQ